MWSITTIFFISVIYSMYKVYLDRIWIKQDKCTHSQVLKRSLLSCSENHHSPVSLQPCWADTRQFMMIVEVYLFLKWHWGLQLCTKEWTDSHQSFMIKSYTILASRVGTAIHLCYQHLKVHWVNCEKVVSRILFQTSGLRQLYDLWKGRRQLIALATKTKQIETLHY